MNSCCGKLNFIQDNFKLFCFCFLFPKCSDIFLWLQNFQKNYVIVPALIQCIYCLSRCSRVYWSTTDARKRCVYTCKIMECRPPLLDSDINSTMEHDDNRTIVHSPVSLSGVGQQKRVSSWQLPLICCLSCLGSSFSELPLN